MTQQAKIIEVMAKAVCCGYLPCGGCSGTQYANATKRAQAVIEALSSAGFTIAPKEATEAAPELDLDDVRFRKVGYTKAARNFPLTDEAFKYLCQYNGISPDLAPSEWKYAPNAAMRDMLECRAAISSLNTGE